MSSFEIRVDASLKDDKHTDLDVVGVGFQIVNTSNGADECIAEGKFSYHSEDINSTEAELLGIYRALYRLKRITRDERVVIATVINDNQVAIEQLQENNPKYSTAEDILDLCEDAFHTTHWKETNHDEIFWQDRVAKTAANKLIHQ